MAHWLDRYRDHEIEILYLTDSPYRDRGLLADFGDGWIELHKRGGHGETFLVPVSAIRLIKILAGPQTSENRLLRPVEPSAVPEDEATSRRAPTSE